MSPKREAIEGAYSLGLVLCHPCAVKKVTEEDTRMFRVYRVDKPCQECGTRTEPVRIHAVGITKEATS